MVSNARLDLPEPESPVTTISLSRGISTEMFLRLCTRAPCTAMVVRALGFAFRAGARLGAMGRTIECEESQLLHFHVALLCQLHTHRCFADQPLIGQVLTRRGDTADPEIPLEVVLDLRARARFAHLM